MSKLDPHAEDIASAIKAGESRRSLARRYGVAKSTMDDFARTRGLHGPAAKATTGGALRLVPDGDVSREEILEAELRELRQRAKRDRDSEVQAERVLEEIRSAVVAADVSYEPPEVAEGTGSDHVQALLLSDLHGGEVVTLEGVDGLNEFNWDILVERMQSIHRSLLSFQNNRPYPIDELQVWMLGDMCSGSNHKELSETNEFPAAEQGWRIGMLLGQWIEGLVEHYPKITVYAVPGNHPRLPVKPANKNVFDNFDWMAYKVAQLYTKNYETVEWNIPWGGFVVANVADLNYLLFHGDGIRSTMPGVPWGGVTRRVNALKGSYLQRGVMLDGFALGHFHDPNAVQGGRILMNGSVKGPDEYVLKNFGSAEPATQLLATFQKGKRRLTDVSWITP